MLSRLSSLSKDAVVYGLAGAAARVSGLVLLPVYTRVFEDTESYGAWQIVSIFGALLVAVAALGLDGATSILFFDTDSPVERQRITTLWLFISLLAAVPLTVVLVMLAGPISSLITGTDRYADLFRVGIVVLPFNMLQLVVAGVLRLQFRPRAFALLNVGLTILVLSTSIYLVVGLHMEVMGALLGTLTGTAVASIIGLWAVRSAVDWRLLTLEARPVAARLLRLGAPLVPAAAALWVVSFSNTFFVARLLSTGDTGIFRVGAQIASVLGIAVYAFQFAWSPFSLSIARAPDAHRVYTRVAMLYTSGSVGAAVLLGGAAPIVLLLAKGDYAPASSVIGLLALAAVSVGLYYISALGLNLAQRTGHVGWTNMVAALANIVLNATLIPMWGIVGAAIAALAANLLLVVLMYVMSQRVYPIPFDGVRMAGVWLVGLMAVAIAAAFNLALHPSVWVSAVFTTVLMLGYVAALFLIKAVTPGQVSLGLAGVRAALGRGTAGPLGGGAAGKHRR
ncbi:MAG TPA: oligosaccharide flippase family protein [Chloroflexia bacterium]